MERGVVYTRESAGWLRSLAIDVTKQLDFSRRRRRDESTRRLVSITPDHVMDPASLWLNKSDCLRHDIGSEAITASSLSNGT